MVSPYVYAGLRDIDFATRHPRFLFKRICTVISVVLGISLSDVLSPSRKRPLAIARQMVSFFLTTEYNVGCVAIGKMMNRDHSTILHQIKCHKQDFENIKLYREKYMEIKNNLL